MATSRRSPTPAKGASKSRARHAPPAETLWSRHQRDIWIVLLFLIGLLAALAEISALGPVGRVVNEGLKLAFGVGRVAIPIVLVGLGVVLLSGRIEVDRARFVWGMALALVSVSGLGDVTEGRPHWGASVAQMGRAGGWLGVAVGGSLTHLIGVGGTLAALVAVLVFLGVAMLTTFAVRHLWGVA